MLTFKTFSKCPLRPTPTLIQAKKKIIVFLTLKLRYDYYKKSKKIEKPAKNI